MGAWIFSMKIATAFVAVLSSAALFRIASQPVTEFLADEAPRLYKSIAEWLTPPYLYFIINGIIISIAATSRFQKASASDCHPTIDPTLSATPPSTLAEPDVNRPAEYISKVIDDPNLPEFLAPAFSAGERMELSESVAETDKEEGFVIARSSWSPRRRSSENRLEKFTVVGSGGAVTEKPPVSTRLGRRRSIKASPEGKVLGVNRPRKHDTLESTWRTITDGRPVPLARHLKKSDTWDMHVRATTAEPAQPPNAMHKSESFATHPSATGGSPSSTGKLRREPSLGQDDLNRRVEAFIKKFNEEMRLQRQESLQQYTDVINRSSH